MQRSSSNFIATSICLTPRRITCVILAIAAINILMLAGTWLFTQYYRSIGSDWASGTAIKYLLVQFNLATENVTAVWYSSILLLLIALMAALCFMFDIQNSITARDKILSYGWLLFGSVFILLSLDELGSVHENIGMLDALNLFGDYAPGWVDLLIVPIVIVALCMFFFGWTHLRRSRRALSCMILGISLFLTIPLQEKIELFLWHSFADRDAWMRPVWHLLLEEGAEIFGSLFFFAASAMYLIDMMRKTAEDNQVFRVELHASLKHILKIESWLILFLAIGFSVTMATASYLSSGDKGIAQNWFPSTLAALTGLLCLQFWDTTPKQTSHRWMYLTGAFFFVFLSCYYGAYLRGWLWGDSILKRGARYCTNGGLMVAALVFGRILVTDTKLSWVRAGTFGWIILFILAMILHKSKAGALDFLALAVLLPCLTTKFNTKQSSPEDS